MLTKRRFFIASSGELAQERDLTELLIRRRNSKLVDRGLFFDVERWEQRLRSLHLPDFQSRLDAVVHQCDVLFALFWNRAGRFTLREFQIAFENLKAGRNPKHIFSYFKKPERIDPELRGIIDMQEELQKEGQTFFTFEHAAELELHLSKQMDLLIEIFEAEVVIAIAPSRMLEAATLMSQPQEELGSRLSRDEVRALVQQIGLDKGTLVNPHLGFEEGDIGYFWELGLDRARLEAELLARGLILRRAEEIGLTIPQPGDLSEKAKPVVLSLLNLWRERTLQ